MKAKYSDWQQAPMSAGETATPVVDDAPRYTEKTYKSNDYPKGSVATEHGWYAVEGSISKVPGNNKITVCRGRKPNRYSQGS